MIRIDPQAIGGKIREVLQNSSNRAGSYNYYQCRLANDAMFTEAEMRLYDWILGKFPDGANIHEFAAGVGQLSALLCASGYDVSMSEYDTLRFNLAVDVRNALGLDDRLVIHPEPWQTLSLDKVQCLFSVNAANSANKWPGDKRLFEKVINNGGHVVFTPRLYVPDTVIELDPAVGHYAKPIGCEMWEWGKC